MNNDVDGPMSVEIPISADQYHLVVELYSQLNASGVITGVLDSFLDTSTTRTVSTSVGDVISNVVVTPQNTSFKVGAGTSFFASGLASTNVQTFLAPGQITWTALGGVATITNSGVATGETTGSGSIRASYAPLSLNGSTGITVTAVTKKKTKWTIMVFLNAANDLYQFAQLNVNQMEQAAGNPDVRFVVQWKESTSLFSSSLFNGTRRYVIAPDTTTSINSTLVQDLGTGIDMGSPQTLRTFVNWATNNYPADRYGIVIWNHGNGWRRSPDSQATRAVSYDDELGTSIQIWELPSALATTPFEFVSWDASLMQMMEVAYEIKDKCKYVIGSEESPPGEGLPYDTVFGAFRDNPDATTATLSKSFVDGMLGVSAYATRKITQSVVDTSKLTSLSTAVTNLGTALKNNSSSLTTIVPSVRSSVQKYSFTGSRVYADMYDLCLKLDANTTNASILSATAALKTAVTNAVIWEGHNAQSPGSHGLSIDFSGSATFGAVATDYANMRIATDTSWDEWLTVAP